MARDEGYILIEAIVAIAIFTISIGSFYAIFGNSARMLQRAQRESQATALAQQRLSVLGFETPLAPGTSVEMTDDGFRVETGIRLAGATAGAGRYATRSYWVSVGVSDESGRAPIPETHLSTIKLVRAAR